MPAEPPDLRWTRGPAFAEAAEALGVDTTSIAGMIERDGFVTVLYGDEQLMRSASFGRDESGILRLVEGSIVEHPGLWEKMKASIEQGLRDRGIDSTL